MSRRSCGICDQPGGAYACLESDVITLLGSSVPGNPPRELLTLGACPGGSQVCQEEWGLATAGVAGNYPWMASFTSVRVVIPIADEGPWCGDPLTELDAGAIDQAIRVANANRVIVVSAFKRFSKCTLGDLNCDGIVDGADLGNVRTAWDAWGPGRVLEDLRSARKLVAFDLGVRVVAVD